MSNFLAQAHLANLNDQELLDFLGFCYEEVKTLEERLKNDPEIMELEQQLKDLKNEKYADNIKSYKVQLRAARALVKAKGLRFELPEGLNE